MKITAVHFDGDSTRLAEIRHHSYRGIFTFNKKKVNIML